MTIACADDLAKIFTGATLPPSVSISVRETTEEVNVNSEQLDQLPNEQAVPPSDEFIFTDPESMFTVEQMGIDRRLLLNRKRQLKMYRVWMQAKFKKR